MKRALLVVVVIFVALVLIGYMLPEDREGDPTWYAEVKRLTNCQELQAAFNLAERNGNVSYMEAADDRMRELGCYG